MSKDNKYRGEKKKEAPAQEMHIVSVISEHKKRVGKPWRAGHKRVEAAVRFGSGKQVFTRHIDIPK